MKTIIIIATMLLQDGNQLNKVNWDDDIKNPVNLEYVQEIAWNEDIKPEEVTQKMFNTRYKIEVLTIKDLKK